MKVNVLLTQLDIETATDALARVLCQAMLFRTETARAIVRLAPEMMDLLDTFGDELAIQSRKHTEN